MAMEITNNYNSVYESTYTAQKNTGDTTDNSDYLRKLSKLAPSVEFRMGNTFSTAKSGKTLTINPALLEKMQNDPEQEKETMEMIKGVELITKFMDGIYKASGKTVVFRHSYIDENGKYRAYSCIKSDDRISKKLREERRKNSEKLIAKIKEKAAKRKEELRETLAEKRTAKGEKKTSKAEKLMLDKIAASEDGRIYINDAEFREMAEAIKVDREDKFDAKEQSVIGTNLDLQV